MTHIVEGAAVITAAPAHSAKIAVSWPAHALRAMRAIVWRELFKFFRQYGRMASALMRPALWLLVVAAGMRDLFGFSPNPPYNTYTEFQEYIVPGLVGMVILFNGMQSSLYPFAIGLAYFIPLDLAFSCWFSYLLARGYFVLGRAAGWDGPSAAQGWPFLKEISAGAWIGFRQPVLRAYRESIGDPVRDTRDANPGEVWEEDEFWIDLSWRIDPDGSMGIRRWFESPTRPGEKLTVDEYYGWIFERSVPGLPEAASAEGLTPLAYMRRYGAFRVKADDFRYYEAPVPDTEKGVVVDGTRVAGFDTPSRKLEFWSPTMPEFGWPEHALPGYVRSQVHWSELDRAAGEAVLLPTFRLPTLIHTRSANAKWLVEISHRNPLWVHPVDAARVGIATGDLVRVTTAIGWFVARAWVTEGLRPGIVACSHHMGRWRLDPGSGVGGWTAAPVELVEERGTGGGGTWRIRHRSEVVPFESADPDSSRIWWSDAGVHQNLAFPVQPDPVSGMHCWHQKVRLEPAREGDRYGDVVVDTAKSHRVYREWLAKTRPARPGGLRRPLWFSGPVRPADEAYRLEG